MQYIRSIRKIGKSTRALCAVAVRKSPQALPLTPDQPAPQARAPQLAPQRQAATSGCGKRQPSPSTEPFTRSLPLGPEVVPQRRAAARSSAFWRIASYMASIWVAGSRAGCGTAWHRQGLQLLAGVARRQRPQHNRTVTFRPTGPKATPVGSCPAPQATPPPCSHLRLVLAQQLLAAQLKGGGDELVVGGEALRLNVDGLGQLKRLQLFTIWVHGWGRWRWKGKRAKAGLRVDGPEGSSHDCN